MGGGMLQLAAFGSQDVALVGNPQITFFRQLYKRHSPFAIESIDQAFNGEANFGRQVSATIARTGDLVTRMYLEIELPSLESFNFTFDTESTSVIESEGKDLVRYANSIGHALLKTVELEIGGFRVDRHVSEWMDIWHELTETEEKRPGFNEMIGKYDDFDIADETKSFRSARTIYVPLVFFMNRHPGLALPIICLQFHETRVLFEFRDWHECLVHPRYKVRSATHVDTGATIGFSARFYVDYVYLDTDERRRFAQMPHELLIEQVQFLGDVPTSATVSSTNIVDRFLSPPDQRIDTVSQKVSLNFSHPVKELVWVYQNELHTQHTKEMAFSLGGNAYVANVSSNTFVYADFFNYSMPRALDVNGDLLVLRNTGVVPEGRAFEVEYEDLEKDVFRSVRLLLNGTDRFTARKGSYFRLVNPYQHHTRIPKKKIYSYSFALSPEEHQPSGSLNMSRVDQAHFIFEYEPEITRGRVKIFALGYNVLRIASGLAGIAYSG